MTREEAIERLNIHKSTSVFVDSIAEAIDMAIEALQEPKTIIGIDIPYGSDKGIATIFKGKDEKLILEEVKEIMSVVRCKDCHQYIPYDLTEVRGWCCNYKTIVEEDDFCSYGERRKE